jgi:hypothetical protein
MFGVKPGTYLSVETLERCPTDISSVFTHKHLTRREKLDRDKHSSLLRTLINYGRNFL